MKSYTIFEILRGAGRILLPWKMDPERARLSRVSVLFRAGVSHEINSEEKQPPCPAEALKKGEVIIMWATQEVEVEKKSFDVLFSK